MKTDDSRLRIEDRGLRSEKDPMETGRSEGHEDVPNPMSKVDPVRNAECGVRNIEIYRLKTRFFQNDGMGETRIARIGTNFRMGSR